MSIRFNEKEEWDRDDPVFMDNADQNNQAKLEKRPLIGQRDTDKKIDEGLNRGSKSCWGTCCKSCGICCGVFIVILVIALIIGAIILAIEAYPLYKGFKTAQGLYVEVNSDHPDYMKVAQQLYSIS